MSDKKPLEKMVKSKTIERLVKSRNHALNSVADPNATKFNKFYYWAFVLTWSSYTVYWIYLCIGGFRKIDSLGPVSYLLGTGFTITSMFIELFFFFYLLHQVIRQTKGRRHLKNLRS